MTRGPQDDECSMGMVMKFAVGAMDEAAWLGGVALRSTEAAQAAMAALATASILAHKTKLAMINPEEEHYGNEHGDDEVRLLSEDTHALIKNNYFSFKMGSKLRIALWNESQQNL